MVHGMYEESTPTPAELEERIRILESQIEDLWERLNILENR